jgi:hypothetical protein
MIPIKKNARISIEGIYNGKTKLPLSRCMHQIQECDLIRV